MFRDSVVRIRGSCKLREYYNCSLRRSRNLTLIINQNLTSVEFRRRRRLRA